MAPLLAMQLHRAAAMTALLAMQLQLAAAMTAPSQRAASAPSRRNLLRGVVGTTLLPGAAGAAAAAPVVVIGANGRTGSECVKALLARSTPVVACARSGNDLGLESRLLSTQPCDVVDRDRRSERGGSGRRRGASAATTAPSAVERSKNRGNPSRSRRAAAGFAGPRARPSGFGSAVFGTLEPRGSAFVIPRSCARRSHDDLHALRPNVTVAEGLLRGRGGEGLGASGAGRSWERRRMHAGDS